MDLPETLETKLQEEAKKVSDDVVDVLSGHNIPVELWSYVGHVLIAGYRDAIQDLSAKRGKNGFFSKNQSYIDESEFMKYFSDFSRMGLFREEDCGTFRPLFEAVYIKAIVHRQKYEFPLESGLQKIDMYAHTLLSHEKVRRQYPEKLAELKERMPKTA